MAGPNRPGGDRPKRHRSDDRKSKGRRPPGDRGAERPSPRGRITAVTSGQLPRWLKEEVQRSTPKERREPALLHISKGMQQFADERYKAAAVELRRAKELSSRAPTIRELLGLSAYRSQQWEEALRELRTYRRITGDLTHTPVELDCLRALGKDDGVEKTWRLIQDGDVRTDTQHEARVVYASYLLDKNRPRDAWAVIKPGRLVASPSEGELRRWFVAARVALAAGDKDAARKLLTALEKQETDFEGVEELREQLA
jgi:hypothetical protein